MQTCPDDNTLARMMQGHLDEADTVQIQRHIEGCAGCSELLRELAAMMDFEGDDAECAEHARIGRYELREVLGMGAFGVVYRAWDPELSRELAIKLLRQDRFEQESAARQEADARLVQEARALAALNHPNIVTVHDTGRDEQGRLFMASALIDGVSMTQWCQGRRWQDIVARHIEAAQGLGAAHARGIVHRDIKPANMLVDGQGVTRVVDFGLAHRAGPVCAPGSTSSVPLVLTQTGALVGTPAYMSPEQLDGQPATARSDQYALAVALYEALHGFRPFGGETLAQLSAHAKRGVLPLPSSDALPATLHDVLARALRPRASERFACMEDFARALASALKPSASRTAWPWRWVAAASVVGVIGVGVIYSQREDAVATTQPVNSAAPGASVAPAEVKPVVSAPERGRDGLTLALERECIMAPDCASTARCTQAALTYLGQRDIPASAEGDKQYVSVIAALKRASQCAYTRGECASVARISDAVHAHTRPPAQREIFDKIHASYFGSMFPACPVREELPAQQRAAQVSGVIKHALDQEDAQLCARALGLAREHALPEPPDARTDAWNVRRLAVCVAREGECERAAEALAMAQALAPSTSHALRGTPCAQVKTP